MFSFVCLTCNRVKAKLVIICEFKTKKRKEFLFFNKKISYSLVKDKNNILYFL